jgi:hypothetical protein
MAVLLPVDQLLELWPDEFRGIRVAPYSIPPLLIPSWSIPREFSSGKTGGYFTCVPCLVRSTAIAAKPRTT